MITSSRSRLLLVSATVALTVSTLTGCSLLSGLSGQPVREDGEITENGDADVFALRVGDCFDNEDGSSSIEGEVSSIPVVPCDEPHDNEAYYSFDLEGTEYPGDDAITTAGDEGCYDQYDNFVGINYESSTLYYSFISPTEQSWLQGDREILCLILDDGVKTTGTLKGAGR